MSSFTRPEVGMWVLRGHRSPGGWTVSVLLAGEVGESPDFEDVVAGAGGVGEVADAVAGAAGFDGGLGGGGPDDHDVADLVGAEVGVPEDQVAGAFGAGWDAGAVAGGEPVALGGGDPREVNAD